MSVHQLMSYLLKADKLKLMFPNLAKLAAIGLLCTTDCKQGFLALTRMKTNLCSRFSAKTLNHLLVITIEGPAPTDYPYDRACDFWASWRN